MFRKTGFTSGLVAGLLLFAAVVDAQTALGTLRGTVLDEQGGALPGVTVTIRHVETNTVQTTVSSGDGKYFVPNLRPGAYELLSELSGFAPRRQTLELRVGQDLTVNVAMKLAGVAEAVEVVARSVAVETQSTLATVVSNKQIDDLPTIGRNFSALAIIAPGATTSTATGTGQGTGRVDLRAATVHQRDRRGRCVEPDGSSTAASRTTSRRTGFRSFRC